jgi:hypothetical protein
MLPSLSFKYQLSAVEMKNISDNQRKYQYLVDLLAIVGGIYWLFKVGNAVIKGGIKAI